MLQKQGNEMENISRGISVNCHWKNDRRKIRTTYLKLCRGNLLARTQYAALRTDSLTSKVQSMIT